MSEDNQEGLEDDFQETTKTTKIGKLGAISIILHGFLNFGD